MYYKEGTSSIQEVYNGHKKAQKTQQKREQGTPNPVQLTSPKNSPKNKAFTAPKDENKVITNQ